MGRPLRQFDYATISDAILHLKYTAPEDTGSFKNAAISHLRAYFQQEEATPSLRMFNLRQEFPTQWHRFLNPVDPANGNVFELEMSPRLFRILDKEKVLAVNAIWILARCAGEGDYSVVFDPPLFPPPSEGQSDRNKITLTKVAEYGLHFATRSKKGDPALGDIKVRLTSSPIKWRLIMSNPAGENLKVDPAEVEDILFIVGYTWTES